MVNFLSLCDAQEPPDLGKSYKRIALCLVESVFPPGEGRVEASCSALLVHSSHGLLGWSLDIRFVTGVRDECLNQAVISMSPL